LLYHGVTRIKSRGIENFSQKHLPVEAFFDQMKYISKNCQVLSMDQVVEILNNSLAFPSKSVVVTFDDSFENIYTNAAPILEDLNIPTVFYITTGYIDSEDMFWVDKIEDCINRTKVRKIELPYCKETFLLDTNKNKVNSLIKIKDFCKIISTKIKSEIVEALIERSKINPEVKSSKNYRKLTWSQLKELGENPQFIIGGHSHTHSILSQISLQELDFEIGHCIDLLRQNLNREIKHFSYPEGQEDHYNEEVIKRLKDRGIICAPTAIPGLNPKGSDPFHLKRIMVNFMGIPFPYHLQ